MMRLKFSSALLVEVSVFLECMALTTYPVRCWLAFGSALSLVARGLEGGAESALVWGRVPH